MISHFWFGWAVWGYLEDPIVVDVQNAHMICTRCFVASSYNTNDMEVVGGVLLGY